MHPSTLYANASRSALGPEQEYDEGRFEDGQTYRMGPYNQLRRTQQTPVKRRRIFVCVCLFNILVTTAFAISFGGYIVHRILHLKDITPSINIHDRSQFGTFLTLRSKSCAPSTNATHPCVLNGWKITEDFTFSHSHVVQHDTLAGLFTIKKDGSYVIYSNIAYDNTVSNAFSQKLIIKRHDFIVYEVLNFPNVSTVNAMSYNSRIKFSAQLEVNDLVYVTATSNDSVILSNHKSYFGLHII